MASDAEGLSHRQASIFDHLVEAGQWDRVIEMGPQLLADDPEDAYVHNMMTVAALELRDHKLADEHSKTGVRLEPEEALPHRLRARYYRAINRLLLAKKSIEEALRIEPEDSGVWSEYGWNCYERGDVEGARKACVMARSLAPEDLSIEMLSTAVDGAKDDPERTSAFEQIEGYQKSLRLDPECAATHYNIGITYLDQLDDGKNGAEWLRKAAQLDPTDTTIQKALRRAICRCDPILRVLNFPVNLSKKGYIHLDNFRARHPLSIILFFPLIFPAALIAMILFGVWAAFCYVPGKIYQWLTFSEIVQKATGGDRLRTGIYRLPLVVRLSLFFVASGALMVGVFWVFTHPAPKQHLDMIIGGGMIIGMVVGIWLSAKKHAG